MAPLKKIAKTKLKLQAYQHTIFPKKNTCTRSGHDLCVFIAKSLSPRSLMFMCDSFWGPVSNTSLCSWWTNCDNLWSWKSSLSRAQIQWSQQLCLTILLSPSKTMKSKYMHVKLIFKTCSWIPLLWLLFPSAFKNVFPILLVRSPDF